MHRTKTIGKAWIREEKSVGIRTMRERDTESLQRKTERNKKMESEGERNRG